MNFLVKSFLFDKVFWGEFLTENILKFINLNKKFLLGFAIYRFAFVVIVSFLVH